MSLLQKIKEMFFTRSVPLSPGVYHYQAPPEAEFPYRLHLRVEDEGCGILIVNASTVLHLNQTATEYAYHLVSQTSQDEVYSSMSKRYNVSKQEVKIDYENLVDNLYSLIEMPDLDPITYLGFERQTPYSGSIAAPYRLDCALTYQTPAESSAEYAPTKRVDRELTDSEWKSILEKAWNAGIPHIIFTGGEATFRPDLPDLIKHAEDLGQVTGLITNGLRLTDPDYLQELLLSGLDHLMILLEPNNNQAWEALRDSLADDIFITVHLTINHDNLEEYEKMIQKLSEMGVESLSLSVNDMKYKSTLQEVQQLAADAQIDLTWDLPVPYSKFNPVSIELEEIDNGEMQQIEGAGKAWLYLEPDGDVLATQGMPNVLGNLLSEDWQSIWTKIK